MDGIKRFVKNLKGSICDTVERCKARIRKFCENKTGLTLVTLTGGVLAGILNGFLGSGGGIILIFIMGILLTKSEPKDIFATAVLSILPMSAVSAYFYYRGGGIGVTDYAPYYASALFGGILGAILLDKISTTFLKTVFALLMLWAGFRALRG